MNGSTNDNGVVRARAIEHDGGGRHGVKQERIRRFLADRFLFDEGAAIDPAQSLMKAGILDSTGAMELVLFLEDEFKFRVADNELIPENLDSITRIAAYVSRKTENIGA